MKKLPIGLQSFENIITQDFVFIDKTGLLYNLITQTAGRIFFSRPRRFGKSLTCSILEAIFQGRKKLFEGLSISKLDYDWKKYPIIRIDFNGMDHETPTELRVAILELINEMAEQNQIIIKTKLLKSAFRQLIIELANKFGPVVVIIDEYDKPILDHIDNREMAIKMRDLLKSFYGVLKDKEVDANLRFLFITGVSKFSKVSIFSELNNLEDISMSEKFATLCGCTQHELETVFAQHIKALAKKEGTSIAAMLDKLKLWYNGFQFSKTGPKIYNPFSLLNCFANQDFSNYWFTSGTPSFLIRLIEKKPSIVNKLPELESSEISVTTMDRFSVETYDENFLTMLVQSGYLTISNYDADSRTYSLKYPNYEIRLSMTEQIFEYTAHLSLETFGPFVGRFHRALNNNGMDAFCQAMQDLFILLPHNVVMNKEKFYHGIFHAITRLIGACIESETPVHSGFVDAVIQTGQRVYVIEFKKGKTPDAALKQICDKKYFIKFKIESANPITLVGISFNKTTKGVVLRWKIKELGPRCKGSRV